MDLTLNKGVEVEVVEGMTRGQGTTSSHLRTFNVGGASIEPVPTSLAMCVASCSSNAYLKEETLSLQTSSNIKVKEFKVICFLISCPCQPKESQDKELRLIPLALLNFLKAPIIYQPLSSAVTG